MKSLLTLVTWFCIAITRRNGYGLGVTSYLELVDLLERATQCLPKSPEPCPESQVVEWLLAMPYSEVREADAACRQFASTLQWPSAETAVLAQLHLRLLCALDLCTAAGPDKTPRMPGDALLRTMLIEYWHGASIDWATWRFLDRTHKPNFPPY